MATTASDMVFAGRDPDAYPVKRMRINTISEETVDAGVTLYSSMLAKDSALKVDNITGLGSTPKPVEIAGVRVHTGSVHRALVGVTSSLSATPTPSSSVATLWQADGTTNVDGDFMATVHNGSTTVTNVLAPAVRYYQGTYTTVIDINFNGTTTVLIPNCTLSLPKGTFLVGYKLAVNANGSTNSSIGVLREDPAGTPADVAASLCAVKAANGTRHCLHKVFPLTVAAATDYQLGFRSSGAGTGVAVDASVGTGETDPDTVPTVWAVQVA